ATANVVAPGRVAPGDASGGRPAISPAASASSRAGGPPKPEQTRYTLPRERREAVSAAARALSSVASTTRGAAPATARALGAFSVRITAERPATSRCRSSAGEVPWLKRSGGKPPR